MNIQHIESFEVTGFSIRTTNAGEMDASTAKIGRLWGKFYSNALPKLNTESKVYGVYTNYESDFSDSFDVIACADSLSLESLEESVKIKIKSGQYLTFSAQGEMPQTVISLWDKIWDFFSSAYSRAYTTDFEYYKSESEVEISIAIK